MISLMYEMFDDIIAAKIITFLEHPTAKMMKGPLEYKEVLKLDPNTDWSERQTLYGFAHIGNHNRHYIAYGGGPKGGIVKSYGDGRYCWHRNWNETIQYTRNPDELDIIYRNDEGRESIKMVIMGTDG